MRNKNKYLESSRVMDAFEISGKFALKYLF
jgi:hypothetical protein